jgi:hypothetical protein
VGLGGDAAALVERGATVIGLDRDPITARLAAHNVPGAGIVVADARRPPFDLSGFAALVDPPRRAGGRREREVPGLAFGDALAIAAEARAAAVKAAASTRRDEAGPSAELTYVQLGRTMRECCMWVGAGATTGLAAALLLPSGTSLDSTAPESAAVSPRVGDVLYDPQPCVTLAGLVTHLAAALGAWRLDPMVGYLSADAAGGHPLATAFEVMEVMPFSLKRLRTVLRTNGWKPGEIRRRAFPVEPDDLRRMLGKLDGEPVTLLLTTIGSSRTAVVARPLSPAESS